VSFSSPCSFFFWIEKMKDIGGAQQKSPHFSWKSRRTRPTQAFYRNKTCRTQPNPTQPTPREREKILKKRKQPPPPSPAIRSRLPSTAAAPPVAAVTTYSETPMHLRPHLGIAVMAPARRAAAPRLWDISSSASRGRPITCNLLAAFLRLRDSSLWKLIRLSLHASVC
jgi:hypothetical protein